MPPQLGDHDPQQIGKRYILPSSFGGGHRAMQQLYQDSMAIVRKMGKPDLFVTFTCNPKWKEIIDALLPGQSAVDRPDIVARVFKLKLQALMDDLLKKQVLGKVIGRIYVIEFQKRGLPHAHILLILDPTDKLRGPDDYDQIICAELPDPDTEPELFEIIKNSMVHGPCGMDLVSPCMDNDDKVGAGLIKIFICTLAIAPSLPSHTDL